MGWYLQYTEGTSTTRPMEKKALLPIDSGIEGRKEAKEIAVAIFEDLMRQARKKSTASEANYRPPIYDPELVWRELLVSPLEP